MPTVLFSTVQDLIVICKDGKIMTSRVMIAASSILLKKLLLDGFEEEEPAMQMISLPFVDVQTMQSIVDLLMNGIARCSDIESMLEIVEYLRFYFVKDLVLKHNDHNISIDLLKESQKLVRKDINDGVRKVDPVQYHVHVQPEFIDGCLKCKSEYATERLNRIKFCCGTKEPDNPSLTRSNDELRLSGVDVTNVTVIKCDETSKVINQPLLGTLEYSKPDHMAHCEGKESYEVQTTKKPPKLHAHDKMKKQRLKESRMRKDKSERKHRCQRCAQAFFSNSQLQDHIRKHEGNPSYICDYCGKGFYRKDRLVIHSKSVHIGEKNFACLVCKKQFIDNYKLKRHLKTHENTKHLGASFFDHNTKYNDRVSVLKSVHESIK